MTKLFVLLLLAHLIADFLVQPKWLYNKVEKLRSIFIHVMNHFIISVILVTCIGLLKQTIVTVTIISIAHFFVDWLKNSLYHKESNKKSKVQQLREGISSSKTIIFVVGQFIQGIIIYICIYYSVSGVSLTNHKEKIKMLYSILLGDGVIPSIETKLICLFIVIIVLTKATSIFISLFLDDLNRARVVISENFQPDQTIQQTATTLEAPIHSGYLRSLFVPPFPSFLSEGPIIKNEINAEQLIKSEVHAFYKLTQEECKDFHIERTLEITEKDAQGIEVKNKIVYNTSQFNDSSPLVASYIGIIERFLITILVVNGAFTGIVFLGALKAIARYKQFDEKNYAEKFLLGTLISALSGLVCGLILLRIFDINIK